MGLCEMIERIKRAFSDDPPYERPPELQGVRQVLDAQIREITRLQQMAEAERQIQEYRDR